MIQIGMLGCGYWGQNLARNFLTIKGARLATICDSDHRRLQHVRDMFPTVEVVTAAEDVLRDTAIDAVVIALPAQDHYHYAKEALRHGKDVLVEKPLSMTSREARELIRLARKKKKILMVGHTFEYNAAVRQVRGYIRHNLLGRVYYIYSQRLNLGIVRRDVDALWNLAPHDVSIILFWLGTMPRYVTASGASYLQKGINDIAFLMMEFPGGEIAHIHVSWLDPSKIRKMTIVGSRKMVVYDDTSEDEKIHIYDKGIDVKTIRKSLGEYENFAQFQMIKRAGDKVIPKIDFVEPLKVECGHFVECIEKSKRPLTDGENGLRVVRVLEACHRSLVQNGRKMEVA